MCHSTACCHSSYPDGSQVWSGVDYYMAKVLSRAMNFEFVHVKGIDGYYGSIVNASTNAFNGLIGMVQRKVIWWYT